MTGQNKSKNLTFAEVLIVFLVCLFFIAVIIPACRKSRSDSFQLTCKKNLSEIGRAMLIYANDYDDEYPRAGGRNSVWGSDILNWQADNRFAAYGLSADGSGGMATISSSFYLLVKYIELMPKSFVCPGDAGITEFKPVDYGASDRKLIYLWDFGPEASKHCSYAYHMPYGLYRLTLSSEPGMAVAADRNPWIDSPAAEAKDIRFFNPDGGRESIKAGNAVAHKNEGQNVLFVDGHVSFEESPACGINNDNIYTFWDGGDIRRGGMTIPGASEPADKLDSFLVNEPATYKKTVTKEGKVIDSKDLKQTSVVATLDCPMPEHRNFIWCSTFQMAWDKLKNDIIGEPVKVPDAEEIVARLNQSEVSTRDIEEESFYSTAGIVKNGIIEEIQKEIKKRFPSEPVPVFLELDTLPPDLKRETIVTYSYLEVDVGFKHPFHNTNGAFIFQDSKGKRIGVTAFRTDTERDSALREQIEILYYKEGQRANTAEFVVDLCKHTQPYQVILALVPRCDTLSETVATVEKRISEFKQNPRYETLRKLRPTDFMPGDSLIVPDILYKLTHQFSELEGKEIKNEKYLGFWFFIVKQMIDFSLSRTGVTMKSQAIIAPAPARLPEPRRLYFNRPFLVYVKKRQGGTNPFFVMWVDNAELMNEF
jgi:prepilin-type processing-associated H-X9-DG protein